MNTRPTLTINFFKSYSEEGEKLRELFEKELIPFFNNKLSINASFETHDSAGLAPKDGNSPFKVLVAAFNNEIVIIDASIEEFEDRKFGVNYDCITPAVSSLDNVLVVSRTQLPLNFIACRTNVALLGEEDKLNPKNNKSGYTKAYTNEQIMTWICKEFCEMHHNPEGSRLLRSEDLKIDMTMSFSEIMQKEMVVLDKNMKALQKEKHPKKQAFISYRSYYYNDQTEEEVSKDKNAKKKRLYNGKYDINVVADEIEKYHNELGETGQWMRPFYYPGGVLSNEFMPEIRRWSFVSYPDRKIRECDEFWIFNTQYKEKSEDGNGEEEKGYWDSWWCIGEFMTIVRMKHDKQLVCKDGKIYKKKYNPNNGQVENEKEFKIMLFSPDKERPIEELSFDQIPEMTIEQNKVLSRYFANSDFREAGLESMSFMRYQRYLPKFIRKIWFKFIFNYVFPQININDELNDISFTDYEESIHSHAYDKSFTQSRLLECKTCCRKGRVMEEFINQKYKKTDKFINNCGFVWDFLNINNFYSNKNNIKERTDIIQLTEKDLDSCRQPNGDYLIKCKQGHEIIIRKSEDKFYLYWTPRRGKYTGPNKCVIETVDVYEVA